MQLAGIMQFHNELDAHKASEIGVNRNPKKHMSNLSFTVHIVTNNTQLLHTEMFRNLASTNRCAR